MLKRSLFPALISCRIRESVRVPYSVGTARLFMVATQIQFRVDTTSRDDRVGSLPSPSRTRETNNHRASSSFSLQG